MRKVDSTVPSSFAVASQGGGRDKRIYCSPLANVALIHVSCRNLHSYVYLGTSSLDHVFLADRTRAVPFSHFSHAMEKRRGNDCSAAISGRAIYHWRTRRESTWLGIDHYSLVSITTRLLGNNFRLTRAA